jgi:YD repeat-containing protein
LGVAPEHVFGINDPLFPPALVFVGTTCKTREIKTVRCGDFSIPPTVTYTVPGYIGSSCSFDWGQQGPSVVVGCDSIFPANGKADSTEIFETLIETHLIHEESYDGSWKEDFEVGAVALRGDIHYFMAVFDPNVFIVNGTRRSPCRVDGSISVTLVNKDCETLQKAIDAKVKIYHQKLQTSTIHVIRCSDNPGSPSPHKSELTEINEIASVGVTFIGDVFGCQSCPRPGSPKVCPIDGGGGGGGCSGGVCNGDEGDGIISVGNASVNASFDLTGTLSMYGSPNIADPMAGTPEINAPGTWLRATHYPFSASSVVYNTTVVGDAITSIHYSFNVAVQEYNTYFYAYDMTGSWKEQTTPVYKSKDQVALDAFLEAARGKVQLTHVKNSANETILEFDYDAEGNVIKQTSYDENGLENGSVIYGYDLNGSLARIWAGTNESAYVAPGSGNPIGGRWIDLTYGGVEGKKFLNRIEYGGCSSCRATRVYEKGGPNGELTKIKKTDGTVLASYDYDPKGRYKGYSLGNDVIKVNEWERTDYDPADPNGTTGNNILIRRDFVSNSQYRAKVFMADDNGAMIKEIHYHDLQDHDPQVENNWLVGPYSVYKYAHEGSTYVTTYPKGNKLRKYYDTEGNVIKIQWAGATSPLTQYEYQTPGGYFGSRLIKEINAFGGETTYSYNGHNMETRTEPAPGVGISGSSQQVTTYKYDSQNRLDYEYKKDSTGAYVYTKYVYDIAGNLIKTIENCLDYTSPNPTQGLITSYGYNEYNQLETTTYPSGKVEKNFYSDSGALIADAVYTDIQNNSAISATIYEYEDGKLENKKKAKMDEPFVFTGVESGGITWVTEAYEYDDYGRRIAVTADAGGEHLVTRYEYNNQGEVVCVLKPDQRYQRTIRDGRGLVSMEITGVKIGDTYYDKASTRYYYDLNGNLVKKVDPEGVIEIYQYDFCDRMVKSRRSR